MASDLKIHYNGKVYGDFSFIQVPSSIAGDDKHFSFEIENPTFYEIEEISFITNMPKDTYEVTLPKSIKKFSNAKMELTLKTKELFKSKDPALYNSATQKHQIAIALDYDMVRSFS